jgi:hypothetical protein
MPGRVNEKRDAHTAQSIGLVALRLSSCKDRDLFALQEQVAHFFLVSIRPVAEGSLLYLSAVQLSNDFDEFGDG